MRRGFTLVELLVVVAIIAILASLLLPALSKGRTKAAGIACLSNQRQLQFGWHMYALDHDDQLSPAGTSGGGVDDPVWAPGSVSERASDPKWLLDRNGIIAPGLGRIGPYVRNPDVFRCPSDRSRMLQMEGKPLRPRNYTMNAWIGLFRSFPPLFVEFNTMGDLARADPSHVFVFIDEHSTTISGGRFVMVLDRNFPTYTWVEDIPASRHGNSGVVTYADGHGEIHRWLEESTIRPNLDNLHVILRYWEVPGSRDTVWLAERATRKLD